MKLLETHIVPKLNSTVRIQEYDVSLLKSIQSKSSLKKAIKKKLILINGKTATTATHIIENDVIEIYAEEIIPKKIFKLAIPVIFEDDELAIINKPAGFPTNGNYFKTIENALPHNLKPSIVMDALAFPKPVHRLDNPTSGILIVAKTKSAQIHLHQQFERQEISKIYQAIVIGKTSEKGEIHSAVAEKDAFTNYETIQTVPSLQNEFLSHVKLFPKTGRTHQLRIHLASINHPIIGDQLHGKVTENYKKGLFLCATSIQFLHPTTKEKYLFTIEPPNKYQSFLAREKRRFLKYRLT
ncbi:RluA family pseudouridine synthase [Kordia sp. YSTF-M3]|uniref:RluA family pseudouridine synthase n=1 Tax=Kordia aestuariivivens TaxID=2759037 RepID=A0ABR7QG32_9FLAO|nr:RluA family pseudouridine synthase [Kordia aestuariivivens]MBC8757511.1 RluA family pseudouridine synthase [Kordia aestuariivivens]